MECWWEARRDDRDDGRRGVVGRDKEVGERAMRLCEGARVAVDMAS